MDDTLAQCANSKIAKRYDHLADYAKQRKFEFENRPAAFMATVGQPPRFPIGVRQCYEAEEDASKPRWPLPQRGKDGEA